MVVSAVLGGFFLFGDVLQQLLSVILLFFSFSSTSCILVSCPGSNDSAGGSDS